MTNDSLAPDDQSPDSIHPWRTKWRRLRFELTSALATQPWAYLAVLQIYLRVFRRDPIGSAVGKNTEIVIEGFPRCGNTFAVFAFCQAQTRLRNIAHHCHSSPQILAAARRKIPTLVLVRDPHGAATSYLVRCPYLTAAQVLKQYVRYHQQIRFYSNSFVVATFDEITTDFGAVVRRVNKKFGTDFDQFEHNEENVAECFRRLDEFNKTESKAPAVRAARINRPSAAKEALKLEAARKIDAPELAHLLNEALQIFEEFRSWSGATGGETFYRQSE
ncbi:MAG: hypothetical protein CMJ81_07120 [Planctomycetaceae bacterium]|nr:hypothetical protein [Planctomycetaceae bacterium]MBP61239.1 hypothetical protein [Planctomycetaceae bacterium]